MLLPDVDEGEFVQDRKAEAEYSEWENLTISALGFQIFNLKH